MHYHFSFRDFAIYQTNKWIELYESLLQDCVPSTCLFVTYKSLKNDMIQTMKRVLLFLGYPLTSNLANCLEKNCNGSFKSEKRKKTELLNIYKTISKEKIGVDLASIYKDYVKKFENKLAE